jgi:hypothetical protein
MELKAESALESKSKRKDEAMQHWVEGIEVEIHGIGGYRVVASTEEAARCLLERWPGRHRHLHRRAREACLAALGGEASAEQARQAFVAAARAARIPVRPAGTRGRTRSGPANRIETTEGAAFRRSNREALDAIRQGLERRRMPKPGQADDPASREE